MDDTRDRLIEVLAKYFDIGDSYAYNLTRVKEAFAVGTVTIDDFVEFDDEVVADIADHLLANGVILPPCKVGDTVYKISRNKVKACEVVFIGISKDENCSYFNFVENYADGTFYKSYSMGFGEIGKTVFLTREEAEKALREKEK